MPLPDTNWRHINPIMAPFITFPVFTLLSSSRLPIHTTYTNSFTCSTSFLSIPITQSAVATIIHSEQYFLYDSEKTENQVEWGSQCGKRSAGRPPARCSDDLWKAGEMVHIGGGLCPAVDCYRLIIVMIIIYDKKQSKELQLFNSVICNCILITALITFNDFCAALIDFDVLTKTCNWRWLQTLRLQGWRLHIHLQFDVAVQISETI